MFYYYLFYKNNSYLSKTLNNVCATDMTSWPSSLRNGDGTEITKHSKGTATQRKNHNKAEVHWTGQKRTERRNKENENENEND